MHNAVLGETMKNVRKHIDFKLATTERRRNYLVSEPNHHTTMFFTESLLVIEMGKTQILTIKQCVYLGLLVLDLNETVMYEFWYNYVKPKYGEKAKSCYVDTESFIIHVKAEDIHKDIAEDVEKRSDTSNFKIDRPLPIAKNNKAIGLMKDGLG